MRGDGGHEKSPPSTGRHSPPVDGEHESHHVQQAPRTESREKLHLLSKLRGDEDEPYIKNTTQAVIWIRKAANGSKKWVETCPQAQYEWYLLFKKTKWMGFCAKLALVLLTFFEAPSTCRGTEWQCAHASPAAYSWNLPVIPLRIRMAIAICLYLFVAFRTYVRCKSLGDRCDLSWSSWYIYRGGVCFLGIIFSILTMWIAGQGSLFWLISCMCRPLLLVTAVKQLRKACADISKSVRGYFVVLMALFLTIWVFIWMGMVLFCRTAEGKASFFSWADAAASMWILFTTSNDPNQWIPAYSTSRYSAIFFVVFLVLMLYLLLSLLLAKIYATYQAIYAERGRKFDEKQDKAIDEAFRCLAEYQEEKEKLHINHAVWKAFFAESCNPHIGKISCGDSSAVADNYQQGTKLLEDIIPEMKKYLLDPFGGMSNRLFKKCALVFIDQGMYIPSKTQYKRWHADCCPSFTKFFLQGLDVGKWHLDWDSMVNVAIGVAMPITLWASISFARPRTIRPADFRHYLSFQLLFAISVVYTLGITVKISSLGFVRFWMSRNPSRKVQQRFDFFNVYLLLIAELIFFFLYPLGSIARIIIILHLCRGLRLLALVKPMLTLFKLVGMLIPVFWQYLLVMFVVYYIFAVIGQYWFGGLIYTTNPILAGTNFASAAFWPLNFNDLPSGFVTLFALMIVNNWYEIAQGYMFVTYNSWAAAYFVIFFVIINLIVLNIVLALILEFNAAMESEDDATKPLDMTSMDLEICAGVGSPYNASKILRKALTSSNALPDSDQEDSDGDGEIGTRKSSNIEHLRSRRLTEVEGYAEDDDDVGYSHAMTEGAATETHLYGTFGHSPTVSRGTRKLTDLDV